MDREREIERGRKIKGRQVQFTPRVKCFTNMFSFGQNENENENETTTKM